MKVSNDWVKLLLRGFKEGDLSPQQVSSFITPMPLMRKDSPMALDGMDTAVSSLMDPPSQLRFTSREHFFQTMQNRDFVRSPFFRDYFKTEFVRYLKKHGNLKKG